MGKETDATEEAVMLSTIKVELDENSYFTGNWASIGGNDDWIEVEALPEDTKERTRLKSYRYENGEWVFDEERYELLSDKEEAIHEAVKAEKKINELKGKLTGTDYKVIKCYECSLAGIQLPYDIVLLHEERQAMRDEINELEKKTSSTN